MRKGTKIALIVAAVVATGFGVIGIWGYGFASSVQRAGVGYEQQLSAEYENNQNYLSAFVSTFHETLGIAAFQTDQMNVILTNAVSGRYGEDGFSSDGAFFAAVSEAYPDLSILDIYNDIATQTAAGREGFRGRQTQLLDVLRAYDTWRLEGLVRPSVVRMFDFPSENLVARQGGQQVATGQAALDIFHNLVLEGSAIESFETGRMAPLEVVR